MILAPLIIAFAPSVAALFAHAAGPAAPRPVAPLNCAQAFSDVSRLVCAEPQALRAQRRMERSFRSAWDAFPGDMQVSLNMSQYLFLPYAQGRCGLDAACLAQAYDARAADLDDAMPSPDGEGRALVGFKLYDAQSGRTLALIQIARPRNPAERRWNEAASSALQEMTARRTPDSARSSPEWSSRGGDEYQSAR